MEDCVEFTISLHKKPLVESMVSKIQQKFNVSIVLQLRFQTVALLWLEKNAVIMENSANPLFYKSSFVFTV